MVTEELRVDLEANYLTNSWHSDNIGDVLSARLRRQLNTQCEDRQTARVIKPAYVLYRAQQMISGNRREVTC